jgi:DNA-directed RNA polymerase specialized sigma24 family protein
VSHALSSHEGTVKPLLRGSRPSLPDEVAGLLAALRSSMVSDDVQLCLWVAEKQPRLVEALRSWGRNASDARDLADLLVEEAFIACRKGVNIQREIPWLSGTVAHLWHMTCRANRRPRGSATSQESKGAMVVRLDELPSPNAPPLDVLAQAEELDHLKLVALEAARVLPPPYGNVLVWKHFHGMSWRAIQSHLNNHRSPTLASISGRQAQHLITQAVRMFRELQAGIDPRRSHAQKYLRQKNPWIVASLPDVSTLIPKGAQSSGPRRSGQSRAR